MNISSPGIPRRFHQIVLSELKIFKLVAVSSSMRPGKSVLYAMLAVLLWSTVASAFKLSLRSLDYIQLLFYASLTSLTVFTVVLLMEGRLWSVWKRENLSSAFLGAINPFLYYMVLFKAYSLLPAQEAQALNYTWPIMLALLSIPFLKQRITAGQILGILISFVGVLIVATRGNPLSLSFRDPLGTALGLGSAVIWASYWILNLRDKRESTVKMFWNFAFGFLYTAVLAVSIHRLIIPDAAALFGAIYVGLFEMGITFLVWLKALETAETTAKVANLIYLTPFLSLVLIHFIVGERILLSTIFGLFLIVGGIFAGRWKDHQ